MKALPLTSYQLNFLIKEINDYNDDLIRRYIRPKLYTQVSEDGFYRRNTKGETVIGLTTYYLDLKLGEKPLDRLRLDLFTEIQRRAHEDVATTY